MFGRKGQDQSSFSEYVEKKTRLLRSKVDYMLQGEHIHYYSKSQIKGDPRCKVCGLRLSELKTQRKFQVLKAEAKDSAGG